MNTNTQIEELKKELKEMQDKYDFLLSAVDHLPNPIFMKDENARFFFFNKAYSEFFHDAETDCLHPNARGHERMARVIAAALNAIPAEV